MAFTPKSLDGMAAGARFMKLTGVKKGTCLNTIWRAFGSPSSDGKYNGYPWASDALKGAIAAGALRRGSIASAPPGAVLYWSNVVGNYNRNGKKVYGDAGHVGIKGNGGFWTIDATGNGSLNFVANDALAKKWPWVKFEGYAYGPGAFLGHTVTVAASAGSSTATPISNAAPAAPKPKRKNMYIAWDTNGGGYFGTAEGLVGVDNPEHMGVLRRFIAGEDTFNLVQIGWIKDYLGRCRAVGEKTLRDDLGYLHVTSGDSLKAIHASVKSKAAPTVDSAAIAASVAKAVAAQGVTIDPSAIAKAVASELSGRLVA